MYFEVKVKTPVVDGDKVKVEAAVLLIEADSFGEAENIAYENSDASSDVIGIKISKIENFVNHTPDLEGECPFFLYENKDAVLTDEGKVKKRTIVALVHGFEVDDTKKDFVDFLKVAFNADVKITKVQKTKIVKIIKK